MSRRSFARALLLLPLTLVLATCEGSRIKNHGTAWMFDIGPGDASWQPHDARDDADGGGLPDALADTGGGKDVFEPLDIKVPDDLSGPTCVDDRDCAGAFPDLNACEVALCSVPPGVCVRQPKVDGAECEDLCVEGGVCRGGLCVDGTARDCSDGIECTLDECDPLSGCLHAPDDAACDDDDVCTEDHCVAATGCVNTDIPACRCQTDADCDDLEPCTADKCGADNICDHNPRPDGTGCDDGDPCTERDRCAAGVCEPGPNTCPTSEVCDDQEDNDGDTLVDCDDPDCAGTLGCEAACDADLLVTCDAIVRGTTGEDDNTFSGYGCVGWTESGPDRVLGFQHDTGGDVAIALLTPFGGADLDVFLLDASCEPGTGCLAAGNQTVVFEAQAGAGYYVVVDGWDGQAGPFTLVVDCLGDAEGDCANGRDDDGDGHTDCDDADCASALACGERDCADGEDNDGDDLVDCDDPDCAGTLACEPGCEDAAEVTCDARLRGTTAGFPNQFGGYGCTSWNEGGPERVWALTPDVDGPVVVNVETTDAGVDHDLFLLDATCDPGAGCLDFAGETLVFEGVAGTVYNVVLDGWDGAAGGFVLTVDCLGGPQETDCGNDRDDDGDGHTDCDDADCVGSGDCSEKICDDREDDDGDGLVDCADPDCAASPDCTEPLFGSDESIGCDALVRRTTAGDDNTFGGYSCAAWNETGPDHIFAFEADRSGPVQVTLLGLEPGVDLDVILLDGSADPGDGCITADSETFAFLAQPGTTYYIVVDGWGGEAGPYTLSVDCLLGERELDCGDGLDDDGDGYTDCADADCSEAADCEICESDDSLEEDDTPQSASPAASGATYEGLIARAGDPDWFRLQVCRGAVVTAQAFYGDDDGDVAVEIYRGDGVTQMRRTVGAGGTALARWDVDEEGLAYVRVAPPGGGCTSYALQLAVDASGCANPLEICGNGVDDDNDRATDCADPDCAGAPQCLVCDEDPREENDSAQTATNVGDATVLSGLVAAPGDDDWFRVPVCGGGALAVTSTYTNGGVALELYAANGTTLLAESRFTGGTERVAVVGGGDVLVRVTGATGFCTRYELAFEEVCGILCSDPMNEPNDTRTQATDLGSGGNVTSVRLGPGDEDWYQLRVNNCDSPVVAAVATWDPLKGDVDLELYDASGALLATADAPRGNSASLSVPASGGRFYYLRVTADGNICLPYNLAYTAQCPPACGEADLYEPNDSRATAWGNGSDGRFTSMALPPGDEDWYWYYACSGTGAVAVSARKNEGAGDLDMELYDAAGNRLDVSEGVSDVESVAAVAGGGQRVYVRIFSADPPETCLRYEFTMERDCSATCADDLYEENDTFGMATDAAAGGYWSAMRAATGDDDWYRVAVCPGGTVTTTVGYDPAQGEIDVELYDKSGGRRITGAYGLTGSEVLTWQTPNADTVYVRVFGAGALCAPYTLRIETGACGSVDPGEVCGPDPYEDNDRAETAMNAGTGGSYTTLTAEPGDSDWARVQVCAGGTLTATATWDGGATGNVDLAILAENGTTTLGTGPGSSGRATATATGAAAANLLVRAQLRGSECLPYTLDLRVAGCGGGEVCGPDGFEDDDRRERANAAGTGGSWPTLTGQAGDPDWFAVDFCAAGTLTATARALGQGDPVALRVLRSNGTSVLQSDAGQTGTASVIVDNVADESRLYVVAEGAGRCRPYALDISVTGCGGGGCAADAYEPNDTAAAATDAGSGATLNGLTVAPTSPDWFAVDVCAGGALVATSTHDGERGDLDLFLYASDGATLVDSSQGLGGTEQVSFPSPGGATTVYVQVRGIAGDCLPYGLALVVDGCGGACFDDAGEQNDEPARATQAGTGAAYSDVVAAPGDADWYAVDVCAGGFVYATAMVNPADGDIGLRLYDGDGATVLDSGAASNGTATVSGTAAGAGRRYVRVLSVGQGCVPYTLDIAVDGCEDQCVDDGWEDNDGSATATDGGSGHEFAATAVSGDVDWYRLLVCPNGQANATVTWDAADGDVTLQLYRADGTLVLAGGQGGGGTLTAVGQVPAGETVAFARVEALGADRCIPYEIALSATGCGGACTDDPLEDNDAGGTASDLGGPNSVGGLRAVGGDDDWFSLPVCQGGTLTGTITFDGNAGDVNLYLYASDRTTLLDSSEGVSGQETVSFTTSLATTAYLKVTASAGACATYRLETTVTGCQAGCAADAAEDDDTPATAPSLPDGGTFERTAIRGDRDWFAVPLCAGGHVRLTAAFDANVADLDLRLYGPDGSTVLDVSSGASGQEMVEHATAAATTVYAEAYVAAGTCVPYTMTIVLDNCATGCVDDGAEPDDGAAAARTVQPGTTLSNRVAAQDDPDWVKVDVCAGGTVQARVTYTGEDGQLGVDLYDRDQFTLLGTTGGANGTATVRQTVSDAGVRYIKVYGVGPVCIPYEMTVTVEGCQACTADSLEDDDGPAAANPAPGGGSFTALTAQPSDPDWFSVPVCAGGRLVATLTYDAAAANVGLRLYASDGATPVATSAGGDGSEQAAYTNPLGASTFFVRVLEQETGCGTYDLQLAIEGCGGGCADDALEDNDGPARAVNLGAAGGTYADLVAASGDADWFGVDVCAGGTLVADATWDAGDGTLGLAIFDRTGASLLTSDGSGQGAAHVEQPNPTGAVARYHVSAYALGVACIPYGLTVRVTGCAPVCQDDAEEDDDTAATANPVPAGGLTRDLVAQDADWFAVPVCAGGTVRASVSFQAGASTLDARVYAADGTTALATDSGDDGTLLAQAQSAAAATLYVRVRDEAGGCTPYTLQIAITGCGTCPDDNHEDDDDAAAAHATGAGSISGHIAAPGDPDWYAVTVCAGGTLLADVTWDGVNGDLDLGIYDRDGATPLRTVPGTGGLAEVQAANPHAEPATLYVRVAGVGDRCKPYLLDLAVQGCAAACQADELEEDDAPEVSTPVDPAGDTWDTLTLAPDDADWFGVPVCAGGTLVADAYFAHADGNLNLRLYAADGLSILASATSWDDDEHLVWTAPAASAVTVYLRAYVTTAGACVPYDLDIAVLCE